MYGSSKVDAAPARDHVNRLIAEGYSRQAIAAAAGISARTIVGSVLDSRRQLGKRTNAAILGLTRADIARKTDPTAMLPAVGAARRLQALMRMGWRMDDLAADSTERHMINKVRTSPNQRILARNWLRVAEMYEQREMLVGPHRGNATKAARLGYAPPLAWDDIDDPAATPDFGAETPALTKRMALYQQGLTDRQIARVFHVGAAEIRAWREDRGLPANGATSVAV